MEIHFNLMLAYQTTFQVQQPTILASEGGLAKLAVFVSGSPKPDVYWLKGRTQINPRGGKFRFVDGSSLQVSE